MSLLFLFYLAVILSASVGVFGQKGPGNDFTEDHWNVANEFILQYHSQWSIRRVVIVYHPIKLQESYMMNLALSLFRRLSQKGVSSSFIRIPDPNAITSLRLGEPNQPPIFCILMLTPNEATSGFIRAAADNGGTTGDSISWMHLRTPGQRSLTAEVGLRPDTILILVIVEIKGQSRISRWNGNEYQDKSLWDGPGRPIPSETADQINMDLSGQKLSVAIFHDPPFVYAENITSNTQINDTQITGWLVDLWKDLQNVLKFSTTFYRPSRTDLSAGLFKRAVEELKSGRADVILSPFVLTAGDFETAEFSNPITDLKYRFLLPRVTASSSIDQFLQPFQLILWRATAGMLTLTVILITMAYTLGRYFGFEEEGTPLFELKESIMIIYGSLFAQGPDFTPDGIAARMILWMSFAFGVVISSAYSAALISKLTVGTLEPPFKTIEGMLGSSYTTIYLPDSAPQRLTMTAEVGAWKELRDRKPYSKVMPTVTDAIREVANSWTLSTLLETRERILPKIQDSPLNCKVTLVQSDILRATGHLMLSKSSPYKAAIDQQLATMRTSGRLARVRASWMSLFFEEPCPQDATLPQFGMGNVILPFAIMVGGLVCAIVLLVIEYIIKKWFGRLMAKEDESSALQAIARTQGVRLTKGWQVVQQQMPIIAADVANEPIKTEEVTKK